MITHRGYAVRSCCGDPMLQGRVRNVLVFSIGSLGDTVVKLPCFHLVKTVFPKARITLLTNQPIGAKVVSAFSVLDGAGLVDDYMVYTPTRRPIQLAALWKEVVQRRFDCLVSLAPPRYGRFSSLRDAGFFLACGVWRQYGIPYRKSSLSCQPVEGGNFYMHETERILSTLTVLGRPDLSDSRWWDLRLSDAELDEAGRLMEPIGPRVPALAISIGTKNDVNDWTEQNWSSLVRVLSERYSGYALVAFGSADEHALSDRILTNWTGQKRNLCGVTTPRISAAIIKRTALFLGHDSGPMHLASCVGVPCVVVFSARNRPGEWFPWGPRHHVIYHKTDCFGCGLRTCLSHGKKCILSVTVDEVYQAVVGSLPAISAPTSGRGHSHVL